MNESCFCLIKEFQVIACKPLCFKTRLGPTTLGISDRRPRDADVKTSNVAEEALAWESTEDAWTRGVFWGACTIPCIVWQFGHTGTQQSYLKGPWGPMWEQCGTLLHTLTAFINTIL